MGTLMIGKTAARLNIPTLGDTAGSVLDAMNKPDERESTGPGGRPRGQIVDEIEASARARLGDELDRIRLATHRLAPVDAGPADLRAALALLDAQATIDVDVPTASRLRAGSSVKQAVKVATAWYLRYLGNQVTLLGQATVRFGAALVERTETLEESSAALGRELADLAARVADLEQGH
jgi:hypothetical protein